jgi:hypothetical protein
MLVWGGSSHVDPDKRTGRYDPATGTWTAISTDGAPAGRQRHTAVWTGDEMMVWGGSDRNDGGRYDPLTDSWRPIASDGPSAREWHTAVWTGTEMIVWGGSFGSDAFLGTGARYDPLADRWTPTSPVGAPWARRNHTAVWTGTEMIVWGGRYHDIWEGSTWFDDGGRYDPATDTWTAISVTGAPSGREDHSAVWSGDRMIVWGGYDLSDLDTGGRYDPVTDSWEPISTLDAPTPRSRHPAVWTGREMVIWGEDPETPSPGVGTGGRYDPVADVWTPTSLADAPSRRYTHTAVWTGTHMLVWGGKGLYSLLSGGGYVLGHDDDDDGDGLSECDGDCNDASAASYPGAPEICDSLDNDCDGSINEGLPLDTYHRDADQDGHGHPTNTVQSCHGAPPVGFVSNGDDCDDQDPTINPDATEVCDEADNDCDGSNDEGFPLFTYYTDADGDGHGAPGSGFQTCYTEPPAGSSALNDDCDDSDPLSYPGALEYCDEVDNDCDGTTDELPGPPRPATALAFQSDDATLWWPAQPAADSYDLVRGNLNELLASGGDYSATSPTCLENDDTDETAFDSSHPGTGNAYYYLYRSFGCGQNGSYAPPGSDQGAGRDGGLADAPCP